MNIDKETAKKIDELQILDRNLQTFLAQKQTIQVELNEVLNALSETKATKDDVYKVLGSVMLKTDKESLINELEERKKILEIRVNSIEKQEKLLENRAEKLKEEVNQEIKSKSSKKE